MHRFAFKLVWTLAAAVVAVACLAASATAAPPITEFPVLPTANSEPDKIITGPDGNLWFTEYGLAGNAIGRMSPAGALIAEYPIPTSIAHAEGITVGPDGNVWFAEPGPSKIGRVTPAGTVQDFSTTTGAANPINVIAGPGGQLWFTESGISKIGRMTTAGVPDGEFPTTTASSGPFDLALGPDGNIWFTETNANKIGVMDPAGNMLHEYTVPTAVARPQGIVVGPDGNLWFAEDSLAVGTIGRITLDGTITEFRTPTATAEVVYLTAGPDGNIWFAEDGVNKLGSLALSAGTVTETEFPVRARSFPYGITTGPDCNVWFTEIADSFDGTPGHDDGNRIARVDLGGCPKPAAPPPAATPASGTATASFLSSVVLIDTRTGRGTDRAACKNVAADECRLSLAIKVKAGNLAGAKLISIGRASATIQGGKTGKVNFKLTRKGRRLLAHKKRLPVTATGTSVNRAGASVRLTKRLTLEAKHRRG